MVLSNSSPVMLVDFADKSSPIQFVPDSETKESTTRRALMH